MYTQSKFNCLCFGWEDSCLIWELSRKYLFINYCPLRIGLRIHPQYLRIAVTGLSVMVVKNEISCLNKYGTIKIPYCPKAVNLEVKPCSLAVVSSLYKWNIQSIKLLVVMFWQVFLMILQIDIIIWQVVTELCKGYKPKTVHSVRERTDWGP